MPDAACLCGDPTERVDCLTDRDECLTCHVSRCRECQDGLALQDAAEIAHDGRWC